jgi:hypothetical protein
MDVLAGTEIILLLPRVADDLLIEKADTPDTTAATLAGTDVTTVGKEDLLVVMEVTLAATLVSLTVSAVTCSTFGPK